MWLSDQGPERLNPLVNEKKNPPGQGIRRTRNDTLEILVLCVHPLLFKRNDPAKAKSTINMIALSRRKI
ncbi:hypothetical protein AMJ44_00100 [candidate division WOR-1 bacterium DG_54_3]|uniref:Uncharacterized protein n=1 Tax=candidate division WOR-1 bacterium DG_54_3 TaxID=1703775 RepID=A0A0S7Y6A4_UNCSA|nr:MAG: hypothetical protein AMJ44_00100 [candidate division WOR-1 bacterium DG_54_3]